MTDTPPRPGLRRLAFALTAAIIVVDQATKLAIVQQVVFRPWVVDVTGFFNLVYVENRGISFGFFGGSEGFARWSLTALALAIVVGLAVWLWRAETRPLAIGIGLVMGGALGNVIDRVARGAVVDFLDFHAFDRHWPAFNVADSAIVVGVLVLLADGLFARQGQVE